MNFNALNLKSCYSSGRAKFMYLAVYFVSNSYNSNVNATKDGKISKNHCNRLQTIPLLLSGIILAADIVHKVKPVANFFLFLFTERVS